MNPQDINILVGCEESQAVCKAFRTRGFNAFSCDILPCSGAHPEWHIQVDVLTVIKGGIFTTQSGDIVIIYNWHAGIFFPPCTHIAQVGGRWFNRKRLDGSQREALLFFTKIASARIKYTAIENPKGILSSKTYIPLWFPELFKQMKLVDLPRRPDQVIQPYYFGHDKKKETGLWLHNLQKLIHTNLITPEPALGHITRKGAYRTGSKRTITWLDKVSAKKKAKTFPGIAEAMAQQWGDYLLTQHQTL